MRIVTSDPKIKTFCRRMKAQLDSIPELQRVTVDVVA